MAKSAAYARIKGDIYAIAASIPRGRVATYAGIGEFLDVVPRQVAYLLALRNDVDREAVPWHRVVSDDGSLGRPKSDFHGRTQAELLEADGIRLTGDGVVARFEQLLFRPTTANTGVIPTPRPADLSMPSTSMKASRK